MRWSSPIGETMLIHYPMKWHKCQSIGLKPVVFGLKTNFELQTEEAREGVASAHTAKKRNPLDHKGPKDF